MENVKELVNEIRVNLSQKSSSQKDEVRVMRAMLNDKEYEVGVYGKDGLEGNLCPAQEARTLISSVMTTAAKIPSAEATTLADNYEFKKSDAENMINISKEFVNTYLDTGRKLPFGGREQSDISIIQKQVEECTKTYPTKLGVDEAGKTIWGTAETSVKAHKSVSVKAPAPSWL